MLSIACARSAYDYARLMWIAVEKQCALPLYFSPEQQFDICCFRRANRRISRKWSHWIRKCLILCLSHLIHFLWYYFYFFVTINCTISFCKLSTLLFGCSLKLVVICMQVRGTIGVIKLWHPHWGGGGVRWLGRLGVSVVVPVFNNNFFLHLAAKFTFVDIHTGRLGQKWSVPHADGGGGGLCGRRKWMTFTKFELLVVYIKSCIKINVNFEKFAENSMLNSK